MLGPSHRIKNGNPGDLHKSEARRTANRSKKRARLDGPARPTNMDALLLPPLSVLAMLTVLDWSE